MKRRTRRRIVRTLITCAVIGAMVALACWQHWRAPVDQVAVAATATHQRQVASCEDQIRPRLQKPVDGWRVVDERSGAQGREITFAANFNQESTLYHCKVDPSAMVLAVDGPEQ